MYKSILQSIIWWSMAGLVNFKSLQCISIMEDCYWFLCSKVFTAEQLIKAEFEPHLMFVCVSVYISVHPCDKEKPNLWQREWGMLGHSSLCLLPSRMVCGGACREELLWACVFPCAWQRTSCILPEQHRAHTLPSAVALTNLGLTWTNSTHFVPHFVGIQIIQEFNSTTVPLDTRVPLNNVLFHYSCMCTAQFVNFVCFLL